MDKNYYISVSAASGVEAVTKRELRSIGIEDAPAERGMIYFKGTLKDIARCNMFLRTADRVYILVGSFPCPDFDALYEGIFAINWADYLPQDAKITVNGKCINSNLYGVSACQSIMKKAIIVKLKKSYAALTIPETGSEYKINFSIFDNNAEITFDTSGAGLHKRGYRELVGEASIKETLAAAILLLSVWNKDRALIDPFCGSGTFPIEAALIGRNIAPGLNRPFAYEAWNNFDRQIKKEVREEAQDLIRTGEELRISGFDIDKEAIKLAEHHAAKAGVKDCIHFQRMDMRDVHSRFRYGVMATNPPYGERLMTEREVGVLMRDFSKMFQSLEDWSLYLITAFGDFERCFGRRADKNRKLYNGKLLCRLYTYLGEKPPKESL
jgi:putative N6-adenine-specific DNA methylase